MRRVLWLAALLLAGAGGCIPLFYAYPSISYVPAVNFGPSHKDLFVFRLDIAEETAGPGHYRFRELPITKKGYIRGQAQTAIDDGLYWNCLIYKYSNQTSHTMRLRFYKRGYDVVEIQPWKLEDPFDWKEVTGGPAREKTIDDLLAPLDSASQDEQLFAHLEPGSVSPDHRDALLFAAGEYERVVLAMRGADQGDDEVCVRCAAKAKRLKELAAH